MWTLGGLNIGLNGPRWLVWSLNGLSCSDMVGTRWNKVDTEYGALRLTNLTILPIPKFTNRDPRWSQKGYYGVLLVPVEHFGTHFGVQIWVFMYFKMVRVVTPNTPYPVPTSFHLVPTIFWAAENIYIPYRLILTHFGIPWGPNLGIFGLLKWSE